MSFSQNVFVFGFFPTVLVLYLLTYRLNKIRKIVLISSSLAFYSWGGVDCLLLAILMICANYFFARNIEKIKKDCV